jgi:malate permease and related proteins
MLTGGLANTAFIGLPMIETFYGAEYLGIGIVIDQAPISSSRRSVSSSPRSISSGYAVDAKTVIRRIALFVFFPGFVLALVLMPFEYPAWLGELLKRLGGTLIPLAPFRLATSSAIAGAWKASPANHMNSLPETC